MLSYLKVCIHALEKRYIGLKLSLFNLISKFWKTLISEGVLSVIHKMRYCMLLLIITRFNLFPFFIKDSHKIPLEINLLYFSYLILCSYLNKKDRKKFFRGHNIQIQVVIDAIYISFVYWWAGDIKGETYLFYLIPLLAVARYINAKFLFAFALSIIIFLFLISLTFKTNYQPYPVPFQASMRYVLICFVFFVRLTLWDYIKLMDNIKRLLGNDRRQWGNEENLENLLKPLIDQTKDPLLGKELVEVITTPILPMLQVSAALNKVSANDRKKFESEIVGMALEKLRCETAALFLLEKGKAKLINARVRGKKQAKIWNEEYSPGEGLTGKVIQEQDKNEKQLLTGQTILKNDVTQMDVKLKYYHLYEQNLPSGKIQSFLAVPIYGPNKNLIGILRTVNKLQMDGVKLDTQGFAYNDVVTINIITSLAGCLLPLITNVEREQSLISFGNRLSHLKSESQILSKAATFATNLLQVEDCSFFMVDKSGKTISLVESTTIPLSDREIWEHFKEMPVGAVKEGGLVSYTTATKKPLITNNGSYRNEPGYGGFDKHHKYLDSKEGYSLMILPLLTNNKECIGVMRVINRIGPGKFSDFGTEDFLTAQVYLSQIVSNITNIRNIEKRRKIIELQNKILTKQDEFQLALQEIAEEGVRLLNVDLVTIYPNGPNFFGSKSFNEKWIRIAGERLSNAPITEPRQNGTFVNTIQSKRGYLRMKISIDRDKTTPLLWAEKIRAVLGVSIEIGENKIGSGVLFFSSRDINHSFTEEDIDFAKILSKLTALTLKAAENVLIKDEVMGKLQKQKDDKEKELVKVIKELETQNSQYNLIKDEKNKGFSELQLLKQLLPHQLLSPIHLTRNELDLLERAQDDNDKDICIKNARTYIRQSEFQIRKVLNQAKFSNKTPNPRPCNLKELLDGLKDDFLYHQYLNKKEILLSINNLENVPEVFVDKEAVELILGIIIENGLKYNKEDGYVLIKTEENEEAVIIYVEDSGQGISPEDEPQIFNEGFRGKNALGKEGHGFGLYSARNIADIHYLNLEVKWTELGKGSCFSLTIPKNTNLK